MIVTEEQAKKKLCPSSYPDPNVQGDCLASECMAWRWIDPDTFQTATGVRPQVKLGYCGKAGRPDLMKGEQC